MINVINHYFVNCNMEHEILEEWPLKLWSSGQHSQKKKACRFFFGYTGNYSLVTSQVRWSFFQHALYGGLQYLFVFVAFLRSQVSCLIWAMSSVPIMGEFMFFWYVPLGGGVGELPYEKAECLPLRDQDLGFGTAWGAMLTWWQAIKRLF